MQKRECYLSLMYFVISKSLGFGFSVHSLCALLYKYTVMIVMMIVDSIVISFD